MEDDPIPKKMIANQQSKSEILKPKEV